MTTISVGPLCRFESKSALLTFVNILESLFIFLFLQKLKSRDLFLVCLLEDGMHNFMCVSQRRQDSNYITRITILSLDLLSYLLKKVFNHMHVALNLIESPNQVLLV